MNRISPLSIRLSAQEQLRRLAHALGAEPSAEHDIIPTSRHAAMKEMLRRFEKHPDPALVHRIKPHRFPNDSAKSEGH